jgi:hypothetical protein
MPAMDAPSPDAFGNVIPRGAVREQRDSGATRMLSPSMLLWVKRESEIQEQPTAMIAQLTIVGRDTATPDLPGTRRSSIASSVRRFVHGNVIICSIPRADRRSKELGHVVRLHTLWQLVFRSHLTQSGMSCHRSSVSLSDSRQVQPPSTFDQFICCRRGCRNKSLAVSAVVRAVG